MNPPHEIPREPLAMPAVRWRKIWKPVCIVSVVAVWLFHIAGRELSAIEASVGHAPWFKLVDGLAMIGGMASWLAFFVSGIGWVLCLRPDPTALGNAQNRP